MPSATETQAIYDAYAAIGRTPDAEGLAYWSSLFDANVPYEVIANEWNKSAEIVLEREAQQAAAQQTASYTTQDIVDAYNQTVGTGAATEADFVDYALSVGVTPEQLTQAREALLSPAQPTSIQDMTQQQVVDLLSADPTTQQLTWTPGTGFSDMPDRLAGGGFLGYNDLTGQGVSGIYETYNPYAETGSGDPTVTDAQRMTGYQVPLTQPFYPTEGQYGYYVGNYDLNGNLVDVNFQKAEEHKGWFGENIDWIGPALVLGAAGLGSGLFTGGAGAGAGAGADLAATAVAGVEGAASQLATTAFTNAINAGLPMSAALSAADVAAGLAGSGLTDAAILESALSSAADTASLGAVDASGNVIGGGGSLTIDAGAGLGGSVPGLDTTGLDSLINDITNADLIEAETSIPDTPTDTPTTTPPGSNVPPGPTDTFRDFLDKLQKLPGLGDLNLSNVLGGALSAAGAKSIYDRLTKLGPDIRNAYAALGTDVVNKYGGVSQKIEDNLSGLFDVAKKEGLNAYAAANKIDLANLRQQEFDIMNAMMADPRAAQAAQIEDRRRAQGLGGLQSFNQAYSAQFTDPTTGKAYTVGADPAQVAMYKAWANQDLANYLQADKNALNRYTGLLSAGTQQANLAQNLQNQWMSPLLTGVQAYQTLGDTGLRGWGTAEKAAADAYAKMVQGVTGGVSQGLTGTNVGQTLSGLWDMFTSSNAGGLTNTGNVISETWT